MINILLVENNEVDVMNVKQAFNKVNIINLVNLTSNGLEALIMLRGNYGQPPEVTAEQCLS